MRYLRMLTNSVIAGGLASAYLAILVLHLNPGVSLAFGELAPLALAFALAHGVALALAFYASIVVRQLFSSETLSPGWISVRVLSWSCTIAAAAGATVMWLNVSAYGAVLDAQATRTLTAAAFTVSASAVVFLLIALAHLDRRGGHVSAVLLVAMMVISLAAPLAARGWGVATELPARPTVPVAGVGAARAEGRVILIALDGASLDVISPAVAEGRLPGFGRILDGGAVLHLATLRPTQPEPVWAAIATGQLPAANGVPASAHYRAWTGGGVIERLPDYCFAQALVRLGLLTETPVDSRSLTARPVWHILSDAGVPVSVIGFPLTHPAPPINGLLVSDEFHRLTNDAPDEQWAAAVSPPRLVALAHDALEIAADPDPVGLLSAVAETPQGDADARPDPAPILADRMHLQLLRAAADAVDPRLLAVRFPGLDAVGHYFLRYANPSAFGDVSEVERRRYGRVLADYYGFVDTLVGRAIDALGPDDLLLVVSAFGMEPLSPGKRVLEQLLGNAALSGTHERAPDGFVLAYGAAVAPGRPARASVTDIAPTLLYYFGLPVGRDMGVARVDLFGGAFTASRPITFIPGYGR